MSWRLSCRSGWATEHEGFEGPAARCRGQQWGAVRELARRATITGAAWCLLAADQDPSPGPTALRGLLLLAALLVASGIAVWAAMTFAG